MSNPELSNGIEGILFDGFESLDANYIYCPNQFFDLCLSHSSRGVVRLVSFMLVETLRWRDENGKPLQEEIAVSYRVLIEKAGISRGAIDDVINDAITAGYIEQVVAPQQKRKGQRSRSAQYRIRWSVNSDYCKDLELFDGFFSGQGNCSPIPLSFFLLVVPNERLDDIKFVGTVLRYTVGFENKYGRRRAKAPLSFSSIQRYANYSDRQQAVKAAKRCIAKGYVLKLEQGKFSPDTNEQKPTAYAPHWLNENNKSNNGSKLTPPHIGSKLTLDDQSISNPSISSKLTLESQSKKHPSRKIDSKQTNKQQTVVVSLLMKEGFVERVAKEIAEENSADVIKQQIEWFRHRDKDTNPVGLLRRSIEGNWSEPPTLVALKAKKKQKGLTENTAVMSALSKAEGERVASEREKKNEQRAKLLQQWNSVSKEVQVRAAMELVERTTDPIHKSKIKDYSFSNPPMEFLIALDRHLSNTPQVA